MLIILAIGLPSAFSLLYITPKIVEDRYYQVMTSDADFLAARLDWFFAKSIDDVGVLSKKIALNNPTEIKEAGEDLDLFVKSSAMFTGGLVTDQNGIMLLFNSSPQRNIELKQKNNIMFRDYIQYPLTKGNSYLSDVIFTESSPLPVIFLSSPVVEKGKTTGVLALSINLFNENNVIQSLVQWFQERKKGNIYVVDRKGTIVFHIDKSMVGKTISPEILTAIGDDNKGMINNLVRKDGNLTLTYSRLQTNNWVVIYEMSHNQIYAMTELTRYMSLGTMIGVLVLGLLASILFARIILRPLARITDATAQVAAGDLSLQLDVKGHHDFKELMKNFNIMTANLRSQYEELERISLQDHLTGLANRRYFEQQLKLELERAFRLGHSSTILILDIDNFKGVNDRFGHLEGDKALKALASVLKETLREVDLPARFGGEEFIILLPETSLEQGRVVAEKILERVSLIDLASRKGQITFTVSIGMAGTEQDPERYSADAGKRIIKHADKALYDAKTNGKNRVEIYKK
ncbi:MAG: diguanylate cyclase [Peptococcaceae bacterium]|nr:diguanylate cyclase [Peptococcaceae bacterium]